MEGGGGPRPSLLFNFAEGLGLQLGRAPRRGPLRGGRPVGPLSAVSPPQPLEHLVDLEPRVQVLVSSE